MRRERRIEHDRHFTGFRHACAAIDLLSRSKLRRSLNFITPPSLRPSELGFRVLLRYQNAANQQESREIKFFRRTRQKRRVLQRRSQADAAGARRAFSSAVDQLYRPASRCKRLRSPPEWSMPRWVGDRSPRRARPGCAYRQRSASAPARKIFERHNPSTPPQQQQAAKIAATARARSFRREQHRSRFPSLARRRWTRCSEFLFSAASAQAANPRLGRQDISNAAIANHADHSGGDQAFAPGRRTCADATPDAACSHVCSADRPPQNLKAAAGSGANFTGNVTHWVEHSASVSGRGNRAHWDAAKWGFWRSARRDIKAYNAARRSHAEAMIKVVNPSLSSRALDQHRRTGDCHRRKSGAPLKRLSLSCWKKRKRASPASVRRRTASNSYRSRFRSAPDARSGGRHPLLSRSAIARHRGSSNSGPIRPGKLQQFDALQDIEEDYSSTAKI